MIRYGGIEGLRGFAGGMTAAQVYATWLWNGFTTPDTLTTGALYVPDSDGVLRTAGANQPGIPGARLDTTWKATTVEGAQIWDSVLRRTRFGTVTDYSGDTDFKGMLIEPARTNYFSYCRELSNAIWTKSATAPTLAQDQSGIDGLPNKAWTIGDASGAAEVQTYRSFTVPAGQIGTVSFFLKKDTDQTRFPVVSCGAATGPLADYAINTETGEVKPTIYRLGTAAEQGCSVESWSTDFWRVVVWAVSTGTVAFSVFPADVSDFSTNPVTPAAGVTGSIVVDWFQAEIGAFPTSPILAEATTATRAATVASFASAEKLPVNDFAIMGEVIPSAVQTAYLFASQADANNFLGVSPVATSFRLWKKIGGTTYEAVALYNHAAGVRVQYQVYLSSIYGIGIRVRQFSGGVWGAWSAWATHANTDNAVLGTTFEGGGRAGAGQFAGTYPAFLIHQTADPKAYLESLP